MQLCAANPKCGAWTWNPYFSLVCSLKVGKERREWQPPVLRQRQQPPVLHALLSTSLPAPPAALRCRAPPAGSGSRWRKISKGSSAAWSWMPAAWCPGAGRRPRRRRRRRRPRRRPRPHPAPPSVPTRRAGRPWRPLQRPCFSCFSRSFVYLFSAPLSLSDKCHAPLLALQQHCLFNFEHRALARAAGHQDACALESARFYWEEDVLRCCRCSAAAACGRAQRRTQLPWQAVKRAEGVYRALLHGSGCTLRRGSTAQQGDEGLANHSHTSPAKRASRLVSVRSDAAAATPTCPGPQA